MAPKIPLLVKLAVPAAAFCVVKVAFFQEAFAAIHLSSIFIIAIGLNLFIWFVWQSAVFPKYLSPLRHLPQPKVSSSKVPKTPRPERDSVRAPTD